MSQRYLPSAMSPLGVVVGALVGLISLILLFFFGLIVGAVMLVAGVLITIYLRIRMWQLRRRGPPARTPGSGQIIEGQYSVIEKQPGSGRPDDQ